MSRRRYYRAPWWEYLMVASALATIPAVIILIAVFTQGGGR